jgi:hypothetical protein
MVIGVEHLYEEDQVYGEPLPKSIEEAYQHDKESGNVLWEKAIRGDVQTTIDYGASEFLDPGQSIPEG